MRKQLLVALLALAPGLVAESLNGVWEAKINYNGVEIPFKIEFAGDGPNVRGWLFNGEERETSTGGNFEHGALTLRFDDYAAELTATLKEGVLEGRWESAQK
jgi:hypothetical protein